MKKEVRKAMEKARELEKIPVPTKEEITKIYKEGMQEAEKLRKLLKPQWFIRDEHKKKKPAKTKPKKKKASGSSTRKKKTL